jgi:hypothetical protein
MDDDEGEENPELGRKAHGCDFLRHCEKSLSYSTSQSKSNTAANKPTSGNKYKKAGNVTTSYPPRKRYSNIGEVVVEDADVSDKTGNGSDGDERV